MAIAYKPFEKRIEKSIAKRTKRTAGALAKRKGQNFEAYLNHAAHIQKFFPIRIPDGCKMTIGRQGLKLIRVQTPFDFILIGQQQSIFLDTKTTEANTFPYSQIKWHQLQNLLEASKAGPSGYLIHFETLKQVVFFHAQTLQSVKKQTSLTPKDGVILGTIYDFKLSKILEDWLKDETIYDF